MSNKTIIYGLFLILSFRAVAQQAVPTSYLSSARWNYVRLWTATVPDASASDLIARPLTDVKQFTQYSDGFGRTVESVLKDASQNGNDIVSANLYDPTTGEEIYRYQPFGSNAATAGDITTDGNIKLDPFQEQVAFYNTYLNGQVNETGASSSAPNWAYSQTSYESSPQNRVLNIFAPGVSWVGTTGQTGLGQHSVQSAQWVNTSSDIVPILTINSWSVSSPETNILPVYSGTFYAAGALHKTVTTDEQGSQTVEFEDSYGQLILKKVQLQPLVAPATQLDNGSGTNYTGWLCTYYVYDDHGNLRFVMPPNAMALLSGNGWAITQSIADELCYRYEYDQLGHMIVKKTPGTPTGAAGEVWMVYDQLNRLVMTQDGNMRSVGVKKWHYIQYDVLDRPIADGLITDLSNYSNLSYHISNAATSANNGSGVSAWPNPAGYSANEVLSQIFYDNYSNVQGGLATAINNTTTSGTANTAFSTAYTTAPYPQPLTYTNMTQGLITATSTEVQGTAGATKLPAVRFYDSKGRVIQDQTINISGGTDINTTQYTWGGQVVNTLVAHNYTSGVNPQTHYLATAIAYYPIGRLKMVTKTINSTINGVALIAPATNPTVMITCGYDELGRLSTKTQGSLENLAYTYNVRGWLLGINQPYISSGTGSYFGMELGYDKTSSVAPGNSYNYAVFNGNIAGSVWKTRGDNINHKYDYKYDNASRISEADYNQNTTGMNWDHSKVDFSVYGASPGINISYDANGNFLQLGQNGFTESGSTPIDQLTYSYVGGNGNGNRLQSVSDGANIANSTLGDFHYPSLSTTQYATDNDANITSDFNRSITAITYWSYPNLINTITMANGSSIAYTYDGKGRKLKKVVTEINVLIPSILVNNVIVTNATTNITTTTYYIGDFEYKTVTYTNASLVPLNAANTDVLQFVRAGEGRLRLIPAVGTVKANFVHDYLLRDHQQSVRVGITDENQTDPYPAATGETTSVVVGGASNSAQNYEALYYNFNTADFVPVTSLGTWYNNMLTSSGSILNQQPGGTPANNDPYSQTTAASQKVFQLCGNPTNNPTGDNFGCGITLKVMAGDVLSIYGTSFWHGSGTLPTSGFPISNVLSNLLGVFAGSPAVTGSVHSLYDGTPFNTSPAGPAGTILTGPGMLSPNANQSSGTAPYAGISYIVFNDQFQPQTGYANTDLVSTATDAEKNHNFTVTAPCNGYIFVYLSNQSAINVYFDNLQVYHQRGHMLEEAHYYPTGLLMAGLSDRAWNKLPNYFHYQGQEMQDQEWHNGSGLEEYDFGFRFYDPQLGRWNVQDPAQQYASPYLAMGDNFLNGRDPNGKFFVDAIVLGVGFLTGFIEAAISNHWNLKKDLGEDLLAGLVTAAEAEGAYLTLGDGAAGWSLPTSEAISTLALPFSTSFVASSVFNYETNSSSFKNKSSWQQFWLVAGFNGTAAISAGFNSQDAQDQIDDIIGAPDQATMPPGQVTLQPGAVSQGIGGVLSGVGNNLITNGGKWDMNTTFAGVAGFYSSYLGQFGHNLVGTFVPKDIFGATVGKIIHAAAENIANGVVQQWVGNLENEIGTQLDFQVGDPNAGAYITNRYHWWASYLNGLGGFDSDLNN